MLKLNAAGTELDIAYLEKGDVFIRIEYARFGGGISSITRYSVARVMKRDIVAFSDHGQEFRISKKNPVSIHSEDSEMVKRARMRHDLEKRQRLVGKTIDRLPKIRMDEEFLDFVEKWAEKNNLLVKE